MTIKIKDRSYTDEDIIKCKNHQLLGDYSAAEQYKEVRIEWMGYREKLRALLLNNFSMKEIIRKTKACKDKSTQKMVKEIISLMQ